MEKQEIQEEINKFNKEFDECYITGLEDCRCVKGRGWCLAHEPLNYKTYFATYLKELLSSFPNNINN